VVDLVELPQVQVVEVEVVQVATDHQFLVSFQVELL
jgi:hypothetical protein